MRSLPEQDDADEGLEQLVGSVQVGADDDARDQDDDRALDHLGAARPLDLLQLAPGLLDEAPALARLAAAGLRRRGLHAGAHLRLARARARRCGLRLGGRLAAGALALVATLPAGLAGHYLVSRCTVCWPHQRQYFLNSTRSGVFRFDLFV